MIKQDIEITTSVRICFSRTPDRAFQCFYPFEIILTYLYQPVGNSAARQSVLHHVTSQCIQDFLEAFFMFIFPI